MYVANMNPQGAFWHQFDYPEPRSIVGPEGTDVVQMIRRRDRSWEHLCRFELPSYSLRSYRVRRSAMPNIAAPRPGSEVDNGRVTISADGGGISMRLNGTQEATLALTPFSICVKDRDDALRPTVAESEPVHRVISDTHPRLITEWQLDYHIHFRAEYVLDGPEVHATWRFFYTAPTLVDAEEGDNPSEQDFRPGGIEATLRTGAPSEVYYDVPFGYVRHPNPHDSFIPPLSWALLSGSNGEGFGLVSSTGSQSFHTDGANGSLAVCLGRSTTSGGRRKLGFHVGDTVVDVKHDTEWYKEIFYGEYVHRFAIVPFSSDFRAAAVPARLRALSVGPVAVESVAAGHVDESVASVEPRGVRLAGIDPTDRRLIINETCGVETRYVVRFAGREFSGTLRPFQIEELSL